MKKILLIEDDRLMRENMAELLDLVGYKVELAKNGKEGVEKAQLLPDLIICDIKMPVLDGYGVLHILSKDPKTAGIPFIFVTAKTERSDLRKGMELGADDYLTKPFEDTELLNAVEIRFKKSTISNKQYPDNAKGFNEFVKEAHILLSLKKTGKEFLIQEYDSKELLFKTGDNPQHVFFIEEGKVKTFRLNADGKELISNMYTTGDFFGYKSVFEDTPYDESALFINPGKVLKIPKTDFIDLVYKNRDIAAKLIRIMSKNLIEREEELIHMAYDSVRKRVANKLISLIAEEEDEHLSISRKDLASMVGTTIESLIRTLTELKELDIIDTDYQKITLVDKEKLQMFLKSW